MQLGTISNTGEEGEGLRTSLQLQDFGWDFAICYVVSCPLTSYTAVMDFEILLPFGLGFLNLVDWFLLLLLDDLRYTFISLNPLRNLVVQNPRLVAGSSNEQRILLILLFRFRFPRLFSPVRSDFFVTEGGVGRSGCGRAGSDVVATS